MYNHLRGSLVELSPTRAVVEAGGVGYELFIPVSTYTTLKKRRPETASDGNPPPATLYTHLLVREDLSRLYGFATDEERRVFRVIVGISGLGPSIALAILSSIPVEEFRAILDAGDTTPLLGVRGVGKKLAGRLLLELRDRVGELPGGPSARGEETVPEDGEGAAIASEAVLALVEIGFSRAEAEERVRGAIESLAPRPPGEGGGGRGARITVEDLLRESLRGR